MDNYLTLDIPPGLYKNGTKNQAKGRWYDANLVRFFDRTIRPVGGWRRLKSDAGPDFAQLTGVPRAALAWRTSGNAVTQVIGTTDKLYAIQGGVLRDITPADYVIGTVITPAGAYGTGPFGSGLFGRGVQSTQKIEGGNWQLVPFGNALASVSNGDKKLRVWLGDPAVKPAVPAGAPASVRGVVATPERFLFALGAQFNGTNAFIANARSVAWPSQESTTDWIPADTNTAGDFELMTNGALVCGAPTRGATLLWTDADLHTATYIGGTLVYRFARVGENCGIVSPHAFAMLDGQAVWMGRNGFFRYDGFVKEIPCEVQDYVFGDFNQLYADKVWSVLNAQYGEVWFFYPSSSASEVDRYVVYNYREEHWTCGNLARSAGFDAGAVRSPVWISTDGFIYEHELAPEISAPRLPQDKPYVESGPLQLGEGDRLVRVQRVVPDAKTLGEIRLAIFGAFSPMDAETEYGPFDLSQPIWTQILARQARLRLEERSQVSWRAGAMKLGIKESSRR